MTKTKAPDHPVDPSSYADFQVLFQSILERYGQPGIFGMAVSNEGLPIVQRLFRNMQTYVAAAHTGMYAPFPVLGDELCVTWYIRTPWVPDGSTDPHGQPRQHELLAAPILLANQGYPKVRMPDFAQAVLWCMMLNTAAAEIAKGAHPFQ